MALQLLHGSLCIGAVDWISLTEALLANLKSRICLVILQTGVVCLLSDHLFPSLNCLVSILGAGLFHGND